MVTCPSFGTGAFGDGLRRMRSVVPASSHFGCGKGRYRGRSRRRAPRASHLALQRAPKRSRTFRCPQRGERAATQTAPTASASAPSPDTTSTSGRAPGCRPRRADVDRECVDRVPGLCRIPGRTHRAKACRRAARPEWWATKACLGRGRAARSTTAFASARAALSAALR
jgi:hypothetical protein